MDTVRACMYDTNTACLKMGMYACIHVCNVCMYVFCIYVHMSPCYYCKYTVCMCLREVYHIVTFPIVLTSSLSPPEHSKPPTLFYSHL